MRTFLKVIETHLKIFFHYKWGFFIYFAMRPIGLLINIALFTSIYSYNKIDEIKSYSLNQMVWYFIATGFVDVFICNFTDLRISRKIITGDLTIDLLKPISLFRFEFANAIALRIVGICMEFFPGILIFSLMFWPKFLTLMSLGKYVFLMILAFVMNYFINFLIGLMAFVLNKNSSVTAMKGIFMALIGGSFMPLDFFPTWLNRIFDFLPFKYIIYWPIQVFLNKDSTNSLDTFLFVVRNQVFWIVVLYILCRVSWKRAVKNFCVTGG